MSDKRMVQARVDPGLLDWVDSKFPHGFKQSFIERCFMNLYILIEGRNLPDPDEYANAASEGALNSFNPKELTDGREME